MPGGIDLDFPIWIRLTHLFNILFITLLFRSGIEILGAHPKLYLNDDSQPGTEWIRFTPRKPPADRLWTAKDEEESYTRWLALPGGKSLGLGRQWHFLTVLGWVLTGLLYVVLLFVTPEWRRLIPTSWDVIPQAYQAALSYLQLKLPAEPPGYPFNALQQVTYFLLIFLLAPLQIATALAMSPAIAGRLPWYPSLFGGRQVARSLHFIGLVSFILFTALHLTMVVAHGLGDELAKIVLGVISGASQVEQSTAISLMAAWLVLVIVVHVVATDASHRSPRRVQRAIERVVDPVKFALLHPLTSRQQYSAGQLSPFPRVNGRPPGDEAYEALTRDHFANWALEVTGRVERPLRLTLSDLTLKERQSQVTKHNCIQGWSYLAEWTGVRLSTLLDECRPLPDTHYLVFHAMDNKSQSEPEPEGPGEFYETLDLELARHPQTILAYELNGIPLSVEHGAPLRLRVETQLGFKMVKWIREIEVVASFDEIGEGQGGWREDWQHYSREAGI